MGSVNRGVLMVFLCAASLGAQEPQWTVDVTPASYVEAWDLNDTREWLNGAHAGVDRAVWRGVAIRGEGTFLRVGQALESTWVRGATLGVRARVGYRTARVFVDAAGGRGGAREPVPPAGTRSNYILLFGGGVEIPWADLHVTASARWFHLSNGGREGRLRNPDLQALGGYVGLGWRF